MASTSRPVAPVGRSNAKKSNFLIFSLIHFFGFLCVLECGPICPSLGFGRGLGPLVGSFLEFLPSAKIGEVLLVSSLEDYPERVRLGIPNAYF